MDAPHYVHADVPSDVLLSWMFYYTYHRDMDVPQHVTPAKKKGSKFTIFKVKNIIKC